MKLAVFTPTRLYGGLDVTWNSLKRQRGDLEIIWIVADEHERKRWTVYEEMIGESAPHVEEIVSFSMPMLPGHQRNLAASYNRAMEIARKRGVDFFVSLQDYITIPSIAFTQMSQAMIEDPRALLTCVCHVSNEPGPDAVVNRQGKFTIFEKPFDEYPPPNPGSLWWRDMRHGRFGKSPIEWETNFAAIPRAALYDEELRFDEEFDLACGHENQDYAAAAVERGFRVMLLEEVVAYSLPHKLYWPEIPEHEIPLTKINQRLMQEKWGMI